MFYRQISEQIKVSLTIPKYSKELFELTDLNRDCLSVWLPWVGYVKQVSDTERFILDQLGKFQQQEALHLTITYEGEIAGVLGFNSIDMPNKTGHVGYWLGRAFTGKGIMTKCASDLICVGEEFYGLRRIEIRCATENKKSRSIPERLGFQQEGVLRSVEQVQDRCYDHVVYGYLI